MTAGGSLQGAAASAPGVHPIAVTATDTGLGSGSTTFDIVVLPALKATLPGTGEVKLNAYRCLTAAGSPARIEKCGNKPEQKWEFLPGGGRTGAARPSASAGPPGRTGRWRRPASASR